MLSNLKSLAWSVLACVALVPIGCERFSSCEDTLCDDGLGGAGGTGGGGSDLGGGGSGAGTGGSVDPCDACTGDAPLCNAEKECVECLEASDCDSAASSKCTESGACVPCAANADCAHLDGTNVCDDGTCVECTPETEAEACGENSCNPATNTCTETPRGTRTRCRPCVADSECEENFRCVPMTFQGNTRPGGYCLKLGSSPGGCARPYTVPTTPSRVSLSGADAAQYCGIDETTTTCEALLDLAADKDCTMDTDCGAEGLDDGRCETVSLAPNKCTYGCVADNGCPGTFACGTTTGNEYCGGPTL